MTTTELPRITWGGNDPAEWIRSWQLLWRGDQREPDPVSYTHLTLPTTPYV